MTKAISYLVELTTEIPITVTEQSLKEDKTFYEVVLDKTNDVMSEIDLNQQVYQVRVVSESVTDLKEGK